MRTVIDVGRKVVCDWCNDDHTDTEATGGFLFGSYATCPKCAPRMQASAVEFGEEHMIRARCPEGMRFGDWVRELRGDNNKIIVTTGDDFQATLAEARTTIGPEDV